MKKIYFFIASLFVFSCSNDETANKMEEKLTGELTAMATRALFSEPEKPDAVEPGGGENTFLPFRKLLVRNSLPLQAMILNPLILKQGKLYLPI